MPHAAKPKTSALQDAVARAIEAGRQLKLPEGDRADGDRGRARQSRADAIRRGRRLA